MARFRAAPASGAASAGFHKTRHAVELIGEDRPEIMAQECRFRSVNDRESPRPPAEIFLICRFCELDNGIAPAGRRPMAFHNSQGHPEINVV